MQVAGPLLERLVEAGAAIDFICGVRIEQQPRCVRPGRIADLVNAGRRTHRARLIVRPAPESDIRAVQAIVADEVRLVRQLGIPRHQLVAEQFLAFRPQVALYADGRLERRPERKLEVPDRQRELNRCVSLVAGNDERARIPSR